MRIVKVENILDKSALDDNYVLLFNKTGEFIGLIEINNYDALIYLKSSGSNYNTYESLEELFDYYQGGFIKIIPIEEFANMASNFDSKEK